MKHRSSCSPIIGLIFVTIMTIVFNKVDGNKTLYSVTGGFVTLLFTSLYFLDMSVMVNKYYKSIKANITATLILSIMCVSGLILSSITHGVLQVLCNSVCVVSFWFASIYLSRSINRRMSNKQEA